MNYRPCKPLPLSPPLSPLLASFVQSEPANQPLDNGAVNKLIFLSPPRPPSPVNSISLSLSLSSVDGERDAAFLSLGELEKRKGEI